MYETGASGRLIVLDEYRRKGFGEAVTAEQFSKMRKVVGKYITGHVAHQNNASFKLTTNMGGRWIDNNSWIGIRPKKSENGIPLLGHL